MGNILYKEMIREMDQADHNGKPVVFSLKFVTADKVRRTGGEIIEVTKAQKCVGKRSDGVLYANPGNGAVKQTKNPNHEQNATRNIYLVDSGHVRKVHTRLIIEFNNKKVIP